MGFLNNDAQDFLNEPIPWKEATQKILAATSSSEADLKLAIASKANFKNTEEKERIMRGL